MYIVKEELLYCSSWCTQFMCWCKWYV